MKKIFILDDKDPRNYFETMGIISKSEEGAVIFVRFFDHKENCVDKIFDRKRTTGEVFTLVLELLKALSLIKDPSNWEYSIDHADLYEQQDFFKKDFGEKSAIYFAFKLKRNILLTL
jgi:hypothetical protein